MAITPYSGTVPQRSNQPTAFAGNMDDWISWFTNTAAGQIDTAVAAFNFNSTNSTSTTSITIGTGSKAITVQASKSYVEGMTVRISSTASTSNWMQGLVTSYNSSTGALVVNVTHTSGSGTIAAWTVSLSSAIDTTIPGNRVRVHTGNGYGSTNTKIRRYTTTFESVGSAITYADSATNGGTFTINTAGVYGFRLVDIFSLTGKYAGISVNSNQLTTNIQSITAAHRRAVIQASIADVFCLSGFLDLSVSDVVRVHTDADPAGTSEAMSDFQLILLARS
jgi:hypothetical protein